MNFINGNDNFGEDVPDSFLTQVLIALGSSSFQKLIQTTIFTKLHCDMYILGFLVNQVVIVLNDVFGFV